MDGRRDQVESEAVSRRDKQIIIYRPERSGRGFTSQRREVKDENLGGGWGIDKRGASLRVIRRRPCRRIFQ